MDQSPNGKKRLPLEVKRSKEQVVRGISISLTPEQRLEKLNQMIHFNKRFSDNYTKALKRRLEQDNVFVLRH